jgi:hypothetical protein
MLSSRQDITLPRSSQNCSRSRFGFLSNAAVGLQIGSIIEGREMSRDEIIAANPIVNFLRNRGHEVKSAGENFVTSGCPVMQHKRSHRPVMIYPQTQSWSCHDCKRGGSIIDWLKIEKNISAADAMQMLGGGKNGSSEIVASYDYTDESGALLFQCVRFQPKAFRQRRPDGKAGWIWNLKGVRRVLYRLPELLRNVEQGLPVIVPEGEKDVDAIAKVGFPAAVTCNPLGAGKWRDEYSDTLRGANVFLIADKDKPGREHAQQAAASLHGKAKRVAIVELPDHNGHAVKDVSDWLNAGGMLRELVGLLENAPEWTPPTASETGSCIASRADRNTTSLNSHILSSDMAEDYPFPLAPAALYGLPGEIVRLIDPHTEADPVALLFQLLAAFGNIIGHDTYIVADGARHYLNLYGVLVGQSSKSRKGTSYSHIANLLERVDPSWKKDCVTSGLSSGEGLIWEVRDPIEQTKPCPGRKKGEPFEYETIIADQGETDKRRFVIEGEFASVLKVMRREGNNLSPVIRAAWDSGELNTMVKNCPARATGAHISIIGHITREELRRLLTETESANGFANRFCWLAVRRSKFLPEGGAIQKVVFDEVVEKLKQAIDFASDFLEVRRNGAATELWRAAYPILSEARPGMVGAVTNRGEAQVMRLSAIYALLDNSSLIRPEHHEAAMALWDYCQESAKWIFGTTTGDRNADKILRALKHAPNGLTRTEISAEVFNRHAPSADVDEALRVVHGLKMAYYEIEPTDGPPMQRWFACGSAK